MLPPVILDRSTSLSGRASEFFAGASNDSTSRNRVRTLVELLETQARNHAPRRAFTFLADDGQEQTLTYRELDARARKIAASLSDCTRPGDRALLVFPAGLDFISAFFGCAYAGVLAVPATFPK